MLGIRNPTLLLLLAFVVNACLAETPLHFKRLQRQRGPVGRLQHFQQQRQSLVLSQPQRTRFFARQENAAVTPYPAAEDLKPAVDQPELTYGPPEQIYGPPLPLAEQLASADAQPTEFATNPDAEEIVLPAHPVPGRLVSSKPSHQQLRIQQQQQQQQRLASLQVIQQQEQPQALQPSITQSTSAVAVGTLPARTAALTLAPLNSAISLPNAAAVAAAPISIPTQQYFVVNQPFAYTTQFQSW